MARPMSIGTSERLRDRATLPTVHASEQRPPRRQPAGANAKPSTFRIRARKIKTTRSLLDKVRPPRRVWNDKKRGGRNSRDCDVNHQFLCHRGSHEAAT